MAVDIKSVENKRDLKTFVKIPFKIYKGDSLWVPLLIKDEIEVFSRDKNPAYESAETKLFIAYKDQKPVGRVAAVLSQAANRKYNTKNLRFGWFESINDYKTAQALLNAVEAWGKELGMETLTGPQGFTDLDPEGMLIEGFEELPTIAVYYNYSYYPEFMEKFGFTKDVDYVEFKCRVPYETGIPERLLNLAERIKQRSGLKMFNPRSKREIKNRGKELFRLLDESFEEIYGSVPISEEQIGFYVKKYLAFVDKDMIKLVVNEAGEMVGFMITMPSLSKAFRKAKGRLLPFGWFHLLRGLRQREIIDFYLAGVKKKYRGQGVDLMMVVEIVKTIMKKGFQYTESNPELEDNTKIQAQWKHFNPTIHKRRRIYKKKIG